MKNFLLLFFTIAIAFQLQGQEVPRTIIVEHFTNSRCGICSSRNPGFYTNLNAQEDVLHISYHPSAPYPNCELHQVNSSENDARTTYYGVYGGTPRLVIQGASIPASTNYGSAAIFEPHQEQTSPVSITIQQYKPAGEMIVQVAITAVADNSLGTAKLFLGAAEDVVFYDAPNGEDEHYDVFRQTFDDAATGTDVAVPATACESVIIDAAITPDMEWDLDRLFTVAILQTADTRDVIQAAASDPADSNPIVSTNEVNTIAASVYPNPVKDLLTIQLPEQGEAQYILRDGTGRKLVNGTFQGQTQVDVARLPAGTYWLEVTTAEGQSVRKIVK